MTHRSSRERSYPWTEDGWPAADDSCATEGDRETGETPRGTRGRYREGPSRAVERMVSASDAVPGVRGRLTAAAVLSSPISNPSWRGGSDVDETPRALGVAPRT